MYSGVLISHIDDELPHESILTCHASLNRSAVYVGVPEGGERHYLQFSHGMACKFSFSPLRLTVFPLLAYGDNDLMYSIHLPSPFRLPRLPNFSLLFSQLTLAPFGLH